MRPLVVSSRVALLVALTGLFAESAHGQFSTPSSFAVQSNGNFTGTIPIRLPPTTGGLAPSLAIAYDSHSGEGLLGVGWTIQGLSAITRCPQTVAQDGVAAPGSVTYGSSDRYCLDGARLVAVSGAYGGSGTQYHTEIDSFSLITSYGSAGNGPAYFKVQTKSGRTMMYGNSSSSAVAALGSASIRVWALNQVADTVGNYYTISYTADAPNGAYYPAQISFTANGTSAAQNAITFVYQSRSDTLSSWTNGSMVRIVNRLSQIQVTTSGGTAVRQYQLSYDNAGNAGASRLKTVAECASSTQCLPAISIGWGGGPATPAFGAATTFSSSTLATDCAGTIVAAFGDFNGDGKGDLLCRYTANGQSSGSYVALLSQGGGSFSLSAPWPTPPATYCPIQTNVVDLEYGDFNGDGKQDLLCWTWNGPSSGSFVVALSNGDGTFSAKATWPPSGFFCATGSVAIADVNGDGRQDLVCNTGGVITVALSNGDGTFSAKGNWPTSGTFCPSPASWAVGDFNGDGMQDIACNASGVITVALSKGDGTFSAQPKWPASGTFCGTSSQWGIADFNGDGKQDLVCHTSAGVVTVALSEGNGSFALSAAWPSGSTWCVGTDELLYGDFNGDGRQDIFCPGGAVALSNGDGSFTAIAGPNLSSCLSTNPVGPAVDVNGTGSQAVVCWEAAAAGQITYGAGLSTPDLVTSINDGVGKVTSVTYQPLTNAAVYAKDSGVNAASFPTVDLQGPYYVASSVSLSNGVGGTAAANYTYGGLKKDLTGRGSLGFRWMSATDAQTSISNLTTYLQSFPYTGQASTFTKSLSGKGNGGTLQSTTNTPGCTDFVSASGCAVVAGRHYFPYISQTVTSSWDLTGAAYPTQTSSYTFGDTYGAAGDTYGNLIQNVVTTGDGFSKTTNNYYNNDTTHWWIGQLTKSQVTSTVP